MSTRPPRRRVHVALLYCIAISLLAFAVGCSSIEREIARFDEMSEPQFQSELVDVARRGRIVGSIAVRAGASASDVSMFVQALKASTALDPISAAAAEMEWSDPEFADAIAEALSWFGDRGGLPVGDRLREVVAAFAGGVDVGALRAFVLSEQPSK